MKDLPKDPQTKRRVQMIAERFRENASGPARKPKAQEQRESWESFIARMNAPVTLSAELSQFLGLTGEQE